MNLHLDDKVALVAAASQGLGYATARQLLMEGARVMICSRSREHLDEAVAALQADLGADVPVAAHTADVTKQADVDALIAATVSRFGGLDILITNAGGPPKGTFDSVELDAWRSAIDLTLMSVVYMVKAAAPHLKKSDAASVLTVTSISAKQPIDNLLLSNVIRPAVVGLTKVLSQEYGRMGIRVNSILPGWTRTDRVDYLLENLAEMKDSSPQVEAEKITSATPLGRMADPAEFGRAAVFLVSPAASYVNGVMMPVDGGSYAGLM